MTQINIAVQDWSDFGVTWKGTQHNKFRLGKSDFILNNRVQEGV
jgi:hypothetical protein